MSELFLNRFRTKSLRLKGHDYSGSGIYFITILTDAGIFFFGKIHQGKTQLSPVGKIILKNWLLLPTKFQTISLDRFVIMPDHIHGILSIYQKSKDAIYRVSNKKKIGTKESSQFMNTEISFHKNRGGITKNDNPMLSQNSLSYYIRWFKGKSTYQVRSRYPKLRFAWHHGYYETIIRDNKALYAARKYIENNPIKWEKSHSSHKRTIL